jgi:hypothetical protein
MADYNARQAAASNTSNVGWLIERSTS